MTLKRWQRVCLLLIYAALIAALSLIPASSSPIPLTIWDKFQHFGAYFLLMALAYPLTNSMRWRLLGAVLVIAYSGLLEVAQRLAPGRVASPQDLIANSLGVVCAFAIMASVSLWLRHRSNRQKAK